MGEIRACDYVLVELSEMLKNRKNKMPETNEAEDLSDCYVTEEERVLDPSLVDKSVIERLPQPTGWRILIAPSNPPRKAKAVFY